MNNATEILKILRSAGVIENKEVIDVLEDGAALTALGITDEDQEAIEELHADIKHVILDE